MGAFLTLLGRPRGGGYDWYLDSTASPGGDGSLGAPFNTVADLESAGISTGNSIGVAAGSVFREQLDIAVNNVTVEKYGTGDNPIFDASNIVGAGDWSKTVGRTNVYQAAITYTAPGGYVNVWENDAFLTRVADVATCDSTAGSYYSTGESGAQTLYIHPNGSTDPTSDGKTYETNVRRFGINASGMSNLTINGITTCRNLSTSGSLVVGDDCTLTDCEAQDGNKHCVYVGEGCTLTRVIARDWYYSVSSSTGFVHNKDTATGKNATYVDCQALKTTYKATDGGFYGHINVGGTFGAVTYSGCAVENVGIAYDAANTSSLAITNCTADGCAYFGYLRHNTTISGGSFSNGAALSHILYIAAAVTVTMDGFTCTSEPTSWAYMFEAAAACTLTLTNCTLQTTANKTLIYLPISGSTLNSGGIGNGNTFSTGVGGFYYGILTGGTVVSDYNTFEPDSPNFYLNGTEYLNLAAWQAAGYDLNST